MMLLSFFMQRSYNTRYRLVHTRSSGPANRHRRNASHARAHTVARGVRLVSRRQTKYTHNLLEGRVGGCESSTGVPPVYLN